MKEINYIIWQEGKYNVGQMIKKCDSIMMQMNILEAQIAQTKTFIPMLKRWKK